MSTKIMRHPDPATLLSYAAGTLPEPLAAVIAAHADLCPVCRGEIEDLEIMGGALFTSASFAGIEAAPVRIPERPADGAQASAPIARPPASPLPAPIAATYGLSLESIPWKRLGPGVWHHKLRLSPGVEGDLRLLKIGPGRVMPDHGHGGAELTLVLAGAYSDETGAYRQGDIQDVDESVEHMPVADRQDGCICLIASEQPARFKGLVGRLMQPWTGM